MLCSDLYFWEKSLQVLKKVISLHSQKSIEPWFCAV